MSDFLIQAANFVALSVPVIMVGLLAYQWLRGRTDSASVNPPDEIDSTSLDQLR